MVELSGGLEWVENAIKQERSIQHGGAELQALKAEYLVTMTFVTMERCCYQHVVIGETSPSFVRDFVEESYERSLDYAERFIGHVHDGGTIGDPKSAAAAAELLASALLTLLNLTYGKTTGDDDLDKELRSAACTGMACLLPPRETCLRVYEIVYKCVRLAPAVAAADARIRLAEFGLEAYLFDEPSLEHLDGIRWLLDVNDVASRRWATERWRLMHQALITLGIRRHGATQDGIQLLEQGVELGRRQSEVWTSQSAYRDGIDARAAELQILGLFALNKKDDNDDDDERARGYLSTCGSVFKHGNARQSLVRALNHITHASNLDSWQESTLWTWLTLIRDQLHRYRSGRLGDSLGLSETEELCARLLLELFRRTGHPAILEEVGVRLNGACKDKDWWNHSAGSRITTVLDMFEASIEHGQHPRTVGLLERLSDGWPARAVNRESWDLGACVVSRRPTGNALVRLSRLWDRLGDNRRANDAADLASRLLCDDASPAVKLEVSIRQAYSRKQPLQNIPLDDRLSPTTCFELAMTSCASSAADVLALKHCIHADPSPIRLRIKALIELAKRYARQGNWKGTLEIVQDAIEDVEALVIKLANGQGGGTNDEGLIDVIREDLGLLAYSATLHEDPGGLLAAFELLENARDVADAWRHVRQADRRIRNQLVPRSSVGGGVAIDQNAALDRKRPFLSMLDGDALVTRSLRPLLGVHLVYVVANDRATHALIVSPSVIGGPQAIQLDVEPAWLEQEFAANATATPSKLALARLWHEVVYPILGRVNLVRERTSKPSSMTSPPPPYERPRIWWIGVGRASRVPFHAAAPIDDDDDEQEGTMRYVISSYVQSMGGLRRMREQSPCADEREGGTSGVIYAPSTSPSAQAVQRVWRQALEGSATIDWVDPRVVTEQTSLQRNIIAYVDAWPRGSERDLVDAMMAFVVTEDCKPLIGRHTITGLPADDPLTTFSWSQSFWRHFVRREARLGRPRSPLSMDDKFCEDSKGASRRQQDGHCLKWRCADYDIALAVHEATMAIRARFRTDLGVKDCDEALAWMKIRHWGP